MGKGKGPFVDIDHWKMQEPFSGSLTFLSGETMS